LRGARGQAVAEATVPVRDVLAVLTTVQEFGSQLSQLEAKIDTLLSYHEAAPALEEAREYEGVTAP
jgi:hypothetical protein